MHAYAEDGRFIVRNAERRKYENSKPYVQRLLLYVKAKAGGKLAMGLEMVAVQQKQAQVEEIQRDKHERLRRALERSGAEELRLLSARQNGALGRLAVRRRAAKHDREMELRGKLAGVKGGVARLWKEHNRSCCGKGLLQSSGSADAGTGRKLRGAEGSSRPSSSGQHDSSTIYMINYTRNVAAVPGGDEDEEGGRDDEREVRGAGEYREEGGGAIGTALVGGNLSRSGGRRSGDFVNAGGVALAPSSTTAERSGIARASRSTAADGERAEDGTATASSVPVSKLIEQNTIEETRTASSQRPAATSRTKPGNERGGARWRRRKKRISTSAALAADSAVTTAVAGAIGDGSFGVLSEGEAHALAELGRGAPRDPRLLLSTFPLPTPRRRQRQPESPLRACLQEQNEESKLESTSGDDSFGTGGYGGNGRESVGGRTTGAIDGGKGGSKQHEVLDRAMEKLARKIQAEEDLSRRQLGMAPLFM